MNNKVKVLGLVLVVAIIVSGFLTILWMANQIAELKTENSNLISWNEGIEKELKETFSAYTYERDRAHELGSKIYEYEHQ